MDFIAQIQIIGKESKDDKELHTCYDIVFNIK